MTERSRPYHHGDLRAALVDAALGIARIGGPSGVSLREATRRAGVSPSAAYRHFAGRSHLLDAVASEIQQRMAARMRERMRAPAHADAQEQALQSLRGVGLGYIGFAVDEPGWFETAFFGSLREGAAAGIAVAADGADGPVAAEGDPPAVPPPFALLVEALDECVRAGVLAPERRPGAEFVCWSAVHGCAELVLHGPLRGADETLVGQVSARVVDDIIAGVR
ncbi:TetR/AcrR family transcriptional regulator [Brachybacterium saurashtrense]|uniref:TetR/AcrR family transcriptional regulator n=1 Tax=Brachybacterium saurashtrense TaxID=556288 RepID=A0A345YS33_9MICO|nr:TetR/AcrR family transcriptional regulator [Brachybacterium saurashtrense]AXK46735.1 TetR/AcrR family transcriptional regulator [Brachybacterium saurashtrense]RRR22450.1 TetR/AcrR family transcriptional regulator [Brachybacterium saurashtrense]